MERPVSSFQSRKEFVTPSLAKRGLSSGPKPEYFKGGVAYIYIYTCVCAGLCVYIHVCINHVYMYMHIDV